MMFGQHGVDHGPRCIYRVFPCKKTSIANHGIMQQPFIRRFTSKMLFYQAEFALIADKLLAWELDPGCNGNGGDGRQPEA